MTDDRPILISTNFRWHLWARLVAWFHGVRLVNGPDYRRP